LQKHFITIFLIPLMSWRNSNLPLLSNDHFALRPRQGEVHNC
jgi:hypothetical protein